MQLFVSLHVSERAREGAGGWVVLPGHRAEMALWLFVGMCSSGVISTCISLRSRLSCFKMNGTISQSAVENVE